MFQIRVSQARGGCGGRMAKILRSITTATEHVLCVLTPKTLAIVRQCFSLLGAFCRGQVAKRSRGRRSCGGHHYNRTCYVCFATGNACDFSKAVFSNLGGGLRRPGGQEIAGAEERGVQMYMQTSWCFPRSVAQIAAGGTSSLLDWPRKNKVKPVACGAPDP